MFTRPESLEEALSLLSEFGEDAKCMVGGQSLLLLMREGLVQPELIVDLSAIPDLNAIRVDDEKQVVTIGALATHRAVETSQIVAHFFPVISQAYKYVASPQVRNIGTIGGNLCHNAPGSDLPPILIALCASVTIQKKSETRKEIVETFGTDYYETTLAEDEILTQIEIPLMKENEGIAYQKFAARKTDMATVGVAAWVKLDKDKANCVDIRIGLSGVHSTSVRAASVENALRGEILELEKIKIASHKVQQDVAPISDVHATEEYRREILPIAVQRLVAQAWKQTKVGRGGGNDNQ